MANAPHNFYLTLAMSPFSWIEIHFSLYLKDISLMISCQIQQYSKHRDMEVFNSYNSFLWSLSCLIRILPHHFLFFSYWTYLW